MTRQFSLMSYRSHTKRHLQMEDVFNNRNTGHLCQELFTIYIPWRGPGTLRFLQAESQTISLGQSSTGRTPGTHALQTTWDSTQVYPCQIAFSCNCCSVLCFLAEARPGTSGHGARHSNKRACVLACCSFLSLFGSPENLDLERIDHFCSWTSCCPIDVWWRRCCFCPRALIVVGSTIDFLLSTTSSRRHEAAVFSRVLQVSLRIRATSLFVSESAE